MTDLLLKFITIVIIALFSYLVAYAIPKYLIRMREYIFSYFRERREYIETHNGEKPTVGQVNQMIEDSWEYKHGLNSIADLPLVSHFFCIILIPYDIMSLVRWILQKLYILIDIKGWLTNTFNFIKEYIVLCPYEYIKYIDYDDIVDFCKNMYYTIKSKILNIRF